jgi:hypothetical protein
MRGRVTTGSVCDVHAWTPASPGRCGVRRAHDPRLGPPTAPSGSLATSRPSRGTRRRRGWARRCADSDALQVEPGVSHEPSRDPYTQDMSSQREELHHLIDDLSEEMVPVVLAEVRARTAGKPERPWPPRWFGSAPGSSPDVSERVDEILRDEFGRRHA